MEYSARPQLHPEAAERKPDCRSLRDTRNNSPCSFNRRRLQSYGVPDCQSAPTHQQSQNPEPCCLIPAFHPALWLIDVCGVHDLIELVFREIVRRRSVCADSTQENSGIGFDPAETHAVVERSRSIVPVSSSLREARLLHVSRNAFEISRCDLSQMFRIAVACSPCPGTASRRSSSIYQAWNRPDSRCACCSEIVTPHL